MKKTLFIFVIFGAIIFSCRKNTRPSNVETGSSLIDCTGVAATFTSDANIIIQTNCAISGCHGTGSSNGPGPLLTYTQIFNARVAIRYAVISGAMPLGSSLSTIQKNTIACWIDGGGLDN